MITAVIQKTNYSKNNVSGYGIEICKFGIYFFFGESFLYIGQKSDNYMLYIPFFTLMYVNTFMAKYIGFRLFSLGMNFGRENKWEYYAIEEYKNKVTFPVIVDKKSFHNLTMVSVKGHAVNKRDKQRKFEGWLVAECEPACERFDQYKTQPVLFCSEDSARGFYREHGSS